MGQTPADIARLYDKKFLHIRNHRSLLKVLAKEYTEVTIPEVTFFHRQAQRAKLISGILKKNGITTEGGGQEFFENPVDFSISREQLVYNRERGNTNPKCRPFRVLYGDWRP